MLTIGLERRRIFEKRSRHSSCWALGCPIHGTSREIGGSAGLCDLRGPHKVTIAGRQRACCLRRQKHTPSIALAQAHADHARTFRGGV